MASELALNDTELMTITPRVYQQRVMEKAILRNTLAFMPTGTGKTLIAVMLMKHFAQYCSSEDSRKIMAFIAPTKLLVSQRKAYIEGNTHLRVREYTGETREGDQEIDAWDVKRVRLPTPCPLDESSDDESSGRRRPCCMTCS